MKRIHRTLLLLFAAFILSPAVLTAQQSALQTEKAQVRIIPVRGDIEPSLDAFVRREVRIAQNDKSEFIVFDIDTFGGRVDTALQIASFIMSIKNAQTIAWVRSGESSMGVSWSAGALIAFSCSRIFMAPGTSIGAAAPVNAGADGSTQLAGEKTVSAVRAQMAALAERNDHPVDIALAMVDFDVELWEVVMDGQTRAVSESELERLEASGDKPERIRIISQAGKLLSLTAGEANRYGLASIAADEESLLASLGATGTIAESSPGITDYIISFLTSSAVQVILIIAGLVLLFVEMSTPGFGIPGVTGLLCFVLVFGPGLLLGQVNSLEIILFLVGLGLLVVELFILPGFGIVGISGFLLIGLTLVLSMQDFVIPQFDWEWALLGRNAMVVFIGLVLAVTGIAIIALFGPRLRIFDRFMLNTQITGTAGGPDPENRAAESQAVTAAAEDDENYASLAGKIGVADSILRPSGKALIDGKIYTVEADGAYIDEGRGIIVTRVRGNRIIVRRT